VVWGITSGLWFEAHKDMEGLLEIEKKLEKFKKK